MTDTIECPWRRTERDLDLGVSASAQRMSSTASHHKACQTWAREHHEKSGPSHSYIYGSSSSINLRVLLTLTALMVTWSSLLGAAFATGPSSLVLDTRPPPAIPLMHLQRRQNEEKTTTTKSAASVTSSLETEPDAEPTDFPIPRPFDTAMSNNFTTGCTTFFHTFLTDETFAQCHPFSLMLQTSSALFDASKSFVRITQTLEATCKASLSTCSGITNDLARSLMAHENCAEDYANENPQVLQAYNGLLAYEPLYQGSCLRDKEGSYCYANAVTNRSATADSYPYYLPLGVPLPSGTRATCNSCLQDAMAIFSSFAGNTTQPISKTYNGAAQQIGIVCGTGFVNQTATPLKGAAPAPATSISFTPTITFLLMLLLYFVQ